MSDVDALGRRALHTARVEPLRRRMRAFIAEHGREVDLESIRQAAGDGTRLSELVDDGRTERL